MKPFLRIETREDELNAPAKYKNILQGKATNALSKVSKKSMHYDDKIDNSWINQDNVLIRLSDSSNLNLNVQTHKVLDALILKLTSNFSVGKSVSAETIDKRRTVTLSLDEYMEICGLKDRKKARKQLKEAVQTIYNISMEWREVVYEKNKKVERNWQIRVSDLMGEEWCDDPIRNSKVIFKFTFDIAKYLSQAYIMPYPQNLFQINSKYNPHAYYLGRKLVDHYNQNFEKDNRNRIQVSTLLKGLPDIPTYGSTRRISESIIIPFERDLDALVDVYGVLNSWEYCSKNGELISDKQLNGIDYDDWAALIVLFELRSYPQRQLQHKTKSPEK